MYIGYSLMFSNFEYILLIIFGRDRKRAMFRKMTSYAAKSIHLGKKKQQRKEKFIKCVIRAQV